MQIYDLILNNKLLFIKILLPTFASCLTNRYIMNYDEYLINGQYEYDYAEAEQDEKVYILHDGEQIFESSSDINDLNQEPGDLIGWVYESDFYGKSTEYIIKNCEEI